MSILMTPVNCTLLSQAVRVYYPNFLEGYGPAMYPTCPQPPYLRFVFPDCAGFASSQTIWVRLQCPAHFILSYLFCWSKMVIIVQVLTKSFVICLSYDILPLHFELIILPYLPRLSWNKSAFVPNLSHGQMLHCIQGCYLQSHTL